MKSDPIVEEVHRVRQQMWDEAGGDLVRLIASLRASERQHAGEIVTRQQLDALRRRESRPGEISRSARP